MTAPRTAVGDLTWQPTAADLHAYAVDVGVCGRPVIRRCTDTLTGATTVVPIRCGSTRDSVCPACATRARNLRAQQCAEGWHLEDDPSLEVAEDSQQQADGEGHDGDKVEPVEDAADATTDPGEDPADHDANGTGDRRRRSTRRRTDAAELPRVDMSARTTGRAYLGAGGVVYRPSMFVTLTLPSYGRVVDGVPVDAAHYDYARAARDAVAFSSLFDRWMQNLRRCAGYKVQYFAAIEAQRRLAGHVHIAIRGAIPRAVLRAVTKATYVQQWWPAYTPADIVYGNSTALPVWDGTDYVDPTTTAPLRTWRQALDLIDADPAARPSHITRFGVQVDIKGIISPSADADRTIRYLTKYLTKNIADTYAHPDPVTGQLVTDTAVTAHTDRLHQEVQWIPCSPECANWLRYGIQPKNPGPGAIPGMCPGRAHDRENLGLGGRRVLASRHWSGKTLAQHAADRAAVVRETLAAAGIDAPDADRLAADTLDDDGQPRFVWDALDPDDIDHHTYATAVLGLVRERNQWRQQYEQAKRHRDGPDPGCGQPLSNSTLTGRDEEGLAA